MSQFAGKVALITGRQCRYRPCRAIEFAKQGAKVVVSGRREKEGHEVVAEIKALGGEAIFVKPTSRKRAMSSDDRTSTGEIRPARLCLHNAGIEQLLTPLPDQSEESYDQSWTSTSKAFGSHSSTRFRRC